jgi:CHASE2 domain-containing sensor protein
VSFIIIFGVVRFLGADFLTPITHFFVYREGHALLDRIYSYTFKPSRDIVLVTIDDSTLNDLQAQSDLRNLTISKSQYAQLVDALITAKVKGIAFDIVFQNKDPDERVFAETLRQTPNVVIATTRGG